MKQRITEDWKIAFKQGEKTKKAALEAIKARILVLEKSGTVELPLTNAQIESLISKEIKELQDSRQYYKEESEDYKKISEKIQILNEYLPKQLSEDEVKQLIKEVIEKSNETNKGKLTGLVIKEIGNRFDKSKVSKLIGEVLA
jgi:uncharacterized protein YqeY